MGDEAFYELLDRCREYNLSHRPLNVENVERAEKDERDILQQIVVRWRELQQPPLSSELSAELRLRIKKRYGAVEIARELAGRCLSKEERYRYQWRCRMCKMPFGTGSARSNHERVCKLGR